MNPQQQNLVPEVAAASDETLVSSLIVLTHQIGGTDEKSAGRVRTERDIVRAEILRRMGEGR